MLINEAVEGEKWEVVFVARTRRDDDLLYNRIVLPHSLYSDGRAFHHADGITTELDPTHFVPRVAVQLAHLINARGVSLVDIVDRAARRRAQRQGFSHPSVYWVDIRNSCEVTRGKTDREYHCRWMVRGHWRRYADGNKTWIRPYIKGPAGAPWKGRPVYRVVPEKVAA